MNFCESTVAVKCWIAFVAGPVVTCQVQAAIWDFVHVERSFNARKDEASEQNGSECHGYVDAEQNSVPECLRQNLYKQLEQGGSSSVQRDGDSRYRVRLVVSSLIGGCWAKDAYHTSIVVDDFEFAFNHLGIVNQRLDAGDHASHDGQMIDLGFSTISGHQMKLLLEPYFQAGSYDMLRKNCNNFSDCALFCLLGHRLDVKYRKLERVGTWVDDWTGLMPLLSGFQYTCNPKARDFNLVEVLQYIEGATRRQQIASRSPLPTILRSDRPRRKTNL